MAETITVMKASAVQPMLDDMDAKVQAAAQSLAEAILSRDAALGAQSQAEAARDASFVASGSYADVASGLAATSDGDAFTAPTGDEIIGYRNDSGSATEISRFPAAASVKINRSAVNEVAALLGQVAGQINGGQIALKGGTLADPALRVGTVGVYSVADDTLSIAIAGTEVARLTSSGLTIYGTVTEA